MAARYPLYQIGRTMTVSPTTSPYTKFENEPDQPGQQATRESAPVAEPTPKATPPREAEPEQEKRKPMTNEERKAIAITAKVEKAHAWRVQVWAQSELRIRAMNAELAVLGKAEVEPWQPSFSDDEMLRHYAEMPLA